ncbi:apolipoprotein B receptor isoform X2 [Tamandua tetradactyla]|uniref:apolipoprotein B receptor isoform X2 n=1 Tax=Tamandua tetradactyla TaxID=48850 RepID=UPI0040549E56
MHTHFPTSGEGCCGNWRGGQGLWAGVGMRQGETGEEEVSLAPGKTDLSWWVGTVIADLLDTRTQTDRMDFLRLHLPGLHQALRGALDSFSTFVSYLLGDEVPTAAGGEAQAAKELEEATAAKPGRAVEEGQEVPEHLRGRDGDGELRGPGKAGRHQEGGSAAEQPWGWREVSSHGSQADRQDTEAWEAATTTRCKESSAPLETRKTSEAGAGAGQDMSSQAKERQDEQEVNKEETLRTWELEEEKEEEEVKAKEPGVARGVESEWTWHGESEGKACIGWQKAVGDGRETEQAVKEAVAEETQEAWAREAGREEEMVVVVRGGQSRRAQGMQGPGAESEDWSTSHREEADLPGVRETKSGASEERTLESTERSWALEEASKEDWEELVDEKREAESLFPKHTKAQGVEEGAEDLKRGSEAVGGQGSGKGVGEGLEGQAAQDRKESEGMSDSEIRADEARLEEAVQAEEAKEEKGSCWVAEAEVPQEKDAKGAESEAHVEATPEARSEKEFAGEKSKEEVQSGQEAVRVGWGGLEHEVTESPEPELTKGAQTPTKKAERGQGGEEELWRVPSPCKQEAEGNLEEYPKYMGSVKLDVSEAETWGNRERGNTQEENPDAEGEEEAAGDQAQEAKAEGGRDFDIPEVLETGGEWKRAKDFGFGTEEGEALDAENQEPGGDRTAEAGAGQAPEESATNESKDGEVEAAVPWGEDTMFRRGWNLEEVALSCQDSEDTQTSSSAAEIVKDKDVREDEPEEGAEREAGETWEGAARSAWDSERREEAGRGAELVEAQREEESGGESRVGQECGLDWSADGEVTGLGGQTEGFKVWEGEPEGGQAKDGESAEGSCGMDCFTSNFQVAGSEEAVAMVEAEGFLGEQELEETEAGVWQTTKQGEDSEGQPGDQPPEGEGQRSSDMEDVEKPGGQRPVAEEVDPEGLEDIKGPEEQSTDWDPSETEPGPCWEAEAPEAAGSSRREARGSWSEAALSGSRLDVSIPRSRVLLSRSSSQRRSRPSFRRTPTCEQQQAPPSPPPEKELSAPEQSLLQPEDLLEPSPLRPEGTPVPARKRPLGHGEVESSSQHL